MGATIGAWFDREGRVWMDTGRVHGESEEPVIELLNGAASGTVSWVAKECGPLERIGVCRPARCGSGDE